MPADAINYGKLAVELNECLSDGRIDKIIMSDKTTLVLNIRARGKNWLCALPKGWNCGSAGAIMSYASRGQGAADGTARACLRTLKVKEKKK